MPKTAIPPYELGLYRLWWKDGGSSLASVGCDKSGNRWFAPTNWIEVPSFDWKPVRKVTLIKTKTPVH